MQEQNDVKNTVRVKAGERLITESDVSQKMYVISKGKARVFKTYLGQRVTLAVLGKGEIFGEMSFVDAHPRSASVEALTDMEVIVIDGAKGSEQLENLPNWVLTIFRTVFHRFRELDREITALRSAVSYRKKGMREDIVASTIYLELARFLKTLKMLDASLEAAKKTCTPKLFFDELDGLLGNRAIGLKTFLRLLEEQDFFDQQALKADKIVLMPARLQEFEWYLRGEIDRERYLILSHGSLSVLRLLIAAYEEVIKSDSEAANDTVKIPLDTLKTSTVANLPAALKEIEKEQIIDFKDNVFEVGGDSLHKVYMYQSIIKQFDYTAIYVD